MFWFWVGLVLAVVLALAAWGSYGDRQVRGGSSVRSQGAFNHSRDGISESDTAQGRAEMNATRPDHHAGGGF